MLIFLEFWVQSLRELAVTLLLLKAHSETLSSHNPVTMLWEAQGTWGSHVKENSDMLVNSPNWDPSGQPKITTSLMNEKSWMFQTSWAPDDCNPMWHYVEQENHPAELSLPRDWWKKKKWLFNPRILESVFAARKNQDRQEAQFLDTGKLRSLIGNLVTQLLRLLKSILAGVFVSLPNDSF